MTRGYQDLPPELQAQARDERRQELRAAANFAAVCARGGADGLYDASLWLNECVDAWRLAMMKVARLEKVTSEIQAAFVPIWVEHKRLPCTVGDRSIMAKALRVLMPGRYAGAALTLYRGARDHERSRRIYGFSWTTDIVIARRFAEHWAHPRFAGTGVLLETQAPPGAVLLTREPEDYYDEGEVVVDPYRLGKIKLIEIMRSEERRHVGT